MIVTELLKESDMKMEEALKIINSGGRAKPIKPGFMVHFEKLDGLVATTDYFPDSRAGEELIPDEKAAWSIASDFARNTFNIYVNIYVVTSDFMPVDNYKERKIINRAIYDKD